MCCDMVNEELWSRDMGYRVREREIIDFFDYQVPVILRTLVVLEQSKPDKHKKNGKALPIFVKAKTKDEMIEWCELNTKGEWALQVSEGKDTFRFFLEDDAKLFTSFWSFNPE